MGRLIIIKNICCVLICLISLPGNGQVPPKNWQLLDRKTDDVYGMSVEKAYRTILKDKKPKKKVIVAIIDVGMDITHPAFKGSIWTNEKEIEGNGIDDDGNGYIDDVHGWNFIGECQVETYDCVREYVKFRKRFEHATDTLNPEVGYWRQMKRETDSLLAFREALFNRINPIVAALSPLNKYWQETLHKDSINFGELVQLKLPAGADSNLVRAQTKVLPQSLLSDTVRRNALTLQAVINIYQDVVNFYKGEYETAKTIIDKDDVGYFRRHSPGDDPYTNSSIYYGNSDVRSKISHGNGVAGIIAAARFNPEVKGIASWVEVMPITVVTPKVIGEERDKDVANAIRYAVDNGAKIINFSLGKQTSPQKQLVEASVRYAASRGVLIFAAAGNQASNKDVVTNYLNRHFADGSLADNLFLVGATTSGSALVWSSSNYGKEEVDFFAPGDDIYSTALDGKYNWDSGTSYAAPAAAGLAALIWNYYPALSYKQVAQCIKKSVGLSEMLVEKPGTTEQVPFKALSRLGGLINTYEALKMAAIIH
jgi:cell wall-associated protease